MMKPNQLTENYEYWDLNGCTLSDRSCALVMKALLKCKGHFTNALVMGYNSYPDRGRSVFYRVKLPKDSKTKFEEMTGLKLEVPPKISHPLNYESDRP